MNPTSTPIWQEYLAFIKSWEERNPLDKGDKMTSLRKVYQRAVRLPLEGLERMWRECEDFEVSGNEHLWKNKFSVEYLPKYMAAKAVFRERKQIWEGINPSFLAKPPRERDEEQARQYRLWKRRLSYEKGNPELVDEDGLRARVRHSYGQCLSHLWHFAEIWYDLAEYEFSIGEGDRASRVYQQAVTVVPGSDILRIAQADLEERRGKADEAHKIWRAFLDERHSTVGHIMYLRFVRRNIGKEATRRAFGQTRALRRSGALDYRLYLAHASIELHVNGEPEVARRVLEHGLSKHESYISEPKYVLAYIDFLVQRNEQDNLKVLFERVLEPSAMSAGKARPIWERYVELELCLSRSGGSLTKSEAVEARMHQVYNDEPGMTGLAALWRRCSIAGCGDRPDGEVDTAFKDRVVEAAMGRDQHGKGGRAWRDWARDRDDRPWDGERHHTRGGDSNRSSGANGVEDRRDGGPRGDFRDRSGMPGRGRQEGGGKSAGSGKAGGGDGFSGPGTGGGRSGGTDLDDDEGWTRVGSSVSPLIPPFLRKLFMTLPRHTGPQPDADGLIQALRERALPFKPSTGDDARRGKRRRADSDDEDGPGVAGMEPAPHKKPVRDIFRQRMQANLTPFDD